MGTGGRLGYWSGDLPCPHPPLLNRATKAWGRNFKPSGSPTEAPGLKHATPTQHCGPSPQPHPTPRVPNAREQVCLHGSRTGPLAFLPAVINCDITKGISRGQGHFRAGRGLCPPWSLLSLQL